MENSREHTETKSENRTVKRGPWTWGSFNSRKKRISDEGKGENGLGKTKKVNLDICRVSSDVSASLGSVLNCGKLAAKAPSCPWIFRPGLTIQKSITTVRNRALLPCPHLNLGLVKHRRIICRTLSLTPWPSQFHLRAWTVFE